jgi:type II secretory pathway component GspD/PulD (secretin)
LKTFSTTFPQENAQRSYFDFFDDDRIADSADRDVGRLYGKVRITSEAAANALIITANSQENLDAVIAVVKELDKPSAAGDTTYHIRLNFGNAQKIANRINILFAKNGSQALRPVNQQNPNGANQQPQQQQPAANHPQADDFSLEQVVKEDPYYSWLGGPPDATGRNGSSDRSTDRPVSDLVGRVRVVPDEASSSLLVTANVHLFAQVSKMIEEMDVPPAQVLIDARLVQVSADYLDQIGVRYSPNGSQVFSGADYQNSLMPSLGGNYSQGIWRQQYHGQQPRQCRRFQFRRLGGPSPDQFALRRVERQHQHGFPHPVPAQKRPTPPSFPSRNHHFGQ